MELVRDVFVSPARSGDAEKGSEPYPCTISWFVKGERGSVSWQMRTDWYSADVQKSGRRYNRGVHVAEFQPEGRSIDSHRPWVKGLHENWQKRDNCEFLDGGACVTDGSSLLATDLIPQFLDGGSEFLWRKLEELYEEWL